MTYAQLVARLESLCVTRASEDTEFSTFLPAAIEAGELRCLRDCDFPSARKTGSATLVAGTAEITLPTDLVVMRAAWVSTAAGGTTRQELQRRDSSYLREYTPSSATTGTPKFFALTDYQTMLLAPAPSAALTLWREYTYRPAGLSVSNTTTWLGDRYPDMLVYACMVVLSGYQRNFGANADDPQTGMGWEQMYQKALGVARNEAATGKGWGAFDHTPSAPSSSLAPTGA